MNSIGLFLGEVTGELLYNIVYEVGEIELNDLCKQFVAKTGHQPMDFFGFGNHTGKELFDFVKGIPGLQSNDFCNRLEGDTGYTPASFRARGNMGFRVRKKISLCDSNNEAEMVYKMFNTTYLSENSANTFLVSVAKYREMILIKCVEIMKHDFSDLYGCEDTNWNTPLHLIAALPGIKYDCSTLVKYLLQADVDPLHVNNEGQTFLHVIFGRVKAESEGGVLRFKNERVAKTKWFVEDRVNLLNTLSDELSEAQMVSLVKAQDLFGETVLHEFALATYDQVELFHEFRVTKIFKILLEFGASVRAPNDTGEVPLHFAFNSELFKYFLEIDALCDCRVRNYRDETPVLFILKLSVDFAFAQTSVSTELADQAFVQTCDKRSVSVAVRVLDNLRRIISENVDVRKTAWIPDIQGNIAIDIVLIAIRIGCYNFEVASRHTASLLAHLVYLLREMLRNATASDMKRQNKKGQSFLHILLDIGDNNKHSVLTEAKLLESVVMLLTRNVDVNAVDSKGRTPLDFTYLHHDKRPTFYGMCAQVLIKNGAMSNLRLQNEKRKLRSCSERHLSQAQRLTDPNSDVEVVHKYRYFKEFSIGSGAFSSIFVAIKDENSRSGTIECRAYALKRLEKAKINPQEIKREITTLLSISGECDNIIKYHESFDDKFFQYLCLDLMDGDLGEFVDNKSVNSVLKKDPVMVVQVTKEIINGLAYLHRNDFIHRDLKPGNILYTTDPSLHFKIADFGLTKNMSTLCTMTSTTGSGVAMAPGTRCWMAPELVSMQSREHTKGSDIFSLGLVLHYLLTLGQHPFAARSGEPPYAMERRIVDMQINISKALHPEATNLLQNLLRRDPSKRPPAQLLNQHPFLWNESKKIEFLKAVGDQREAVTPGNYPNSELEQRLQMTNTGRQISIISWDRAIEVLFREMTKAWKQKKYRTDKVIDLIRFIRNAYAHKQERSSYTQQYLEQSIFLKRYPSLVLDVFGVVQKLGLKESRSSISEALKIKLVNDLETH